MAILSSFSIFHLAHKIYTPKVCVLTHPYLIVLSQLHVGANCEYKASLEFNISTSHFLCSDGILSAAKERGIPVYHDSGEGEISFVGGKHILTHNSVEHISIQL